MDDPQTPEKEEDVLTFMYREAVGVLMWTATMTRLDIAFAVRAVARFWKPWTAVLLNDGDAGHTLPDSHERVGGSRLVSRAVDSA